jgi:hypothetical protein
MRGQTEVPVSIDAAVAEIAAILAKGYLRQRGAGARGQCQLTADITETGLDTPADQSIHVDQG